MSEANGSLLWFRKALRGQAEAMAGYEYVL